MFAPPAFRVISKLELSGTLNVPIANPNAANARANAIPT